MAGNKFSQGDLVILNRVIDELIYSTNTAVINRTGHLGPYIGDIGEVLVVDKDDAIRPYFIGFHGDSYGHWVAEEELVPVFTV